MDDGYSTNALARPHSPGHDIGPDEDRNCIPTQRHTVDDGGSYTELFQRNGMFIDCLDETPDNTDMTNMDLNPPDEALYHEINRRKTFDGNWNASYFVHPNDLARNGFIYVGPSDKVLCVFCSKTLWNWEQGDSVEKEHQRHYPSCPFVRGNCNHLNVSDGSFETSLGLQMKTAKQNLPPPVNYSDRLKSYQNWPKHDVLKPEALAEAGLYYLGEEDLVKCFSCEKVLSNWKPGDDPWCEHAKCSPACVYIQSVKGTEFIKTICNSQSCTDGHGLGRSVTEESEELGTVSEREEPLDYRSQKAESVPNGLDLAAQVVRLQSSRFVSHSVCSLFLDLSDMGDPTSSCPTVSMANGVIGTRQPLHHIKLEGLQPDNDMRCPSVEAVMLTYDISVETIRERLTRIRLSKGPDHTVTSNDFKDLMN